MFVWSVSRPVALILLVRLRLAFGLAFTPRRQWRHHWVVGDLSVGGIASWVSMAVGVADNVTDQTLFLNAGNKRLAVRPTEIISIDVS